MVENSLEMHAHNSVKEAVCDTLFDGDLVCWQHIDGYRFSVDSVLLPHFARVQKHDHILDLGTGSGILGLILLYRYRKHDIRVVGVEKQTGLYNLAKRNISANGLINIFSIFHSDVSDIEKILSAESCDLVVSNPPYYPPYSGRTSRDAEIFLARHQETNSLELFVRAASYGVKNRGRVAVIYPADQLAELLNQFRVYRLEPKILQFIYSYPDKSSGAKLVFIEAVKNGGVGVSVRSPFYIYRDRKESYSDGMQAMYLPVKKE